MAEAIFGLLGVLAGGAVTACATVWVHGRQRRAEARVLATSLRAEITALLQLVKAERFEEQLVACRDRSATEGEWWYYSIVADENYFAIYSGTAGRLGVLTAPQAEKVVEYYTLAKAWVENMRLGHAEAERTQALKRLEDNLSSLKRVLKAGEDAVQELSN